MKRKIMVVLLAFALGICIVSSSAFPVFGVLEAARAEGSTVTATGDVNIRSGPSLDYATIKSVSAGTNLEYAGETSVDSRGVSWYKVTIPGSGTGWMSSKYAELHEVQATLNEETGVSPASFDLLSSGEALSREEIVRRYGVFNFNELIHTTDVQADQSGDVQMFTVYFENNVYWGGSEGYETDWMATNGIAAELLCDLDGDGSDEYTIFYVSSYVIDEYDYSYIENQWTAAIFEPVSDGYVFADSFEFNFNWTSDGGESSILLLNSEKGIRIMYGSVGYWDGGNGGIYGTFYGYDGSAVYVDLVFDTETASSAYILTGRIDEDRLAQAITLCDEYQYSDEVPAEDIIENARLVFPNRTSDKFGSLYDYGKMQLEYMNCIEMAAELAAEYGCEMGYRIVDDFYDLYIKGGQQLLWRSEDYRNDQDCIELKFHSTLDHFSQTGNANDAMTIDDAAELYRVENPLSSGMIDLVDGEVVNVQQDIRVNLNMRSDSGICYINYYRINGTEEEWFYGDEISKYCDPSYFVIPANLFTEGSYRIDVDAWIGIGGHHDERIACESVYFYAVANECTHQWINADSPFSDVDSISTQHPNHELHQKCSLCSETKTILSIFDANCIYCTSEGELCEHTWVLDSTQNSNRWMSDIAVSAWKIPKSAWLTHPDHELSATCSLCGETQTSSYNPYCCLCTGAHISGQQPTSVVDATALHPSHTVYCIYCGAGKDMDFDANCTECGAKEVLWYCEFAQLAYNTDRYSDVHAVLPENCIRIDVQREETNIDKNEIVAPDCFIYTTVDSNGTLSVAFAFEGSQGKPYQLLYNEDGDHESLEGWNDWWLTDYAVGKNERGIHRGFSEAEEAFIRYLEGNICIPIPDSFADQFSNDELARNVDGQLCVSWDGLLDYAHTHINETKIRITGHSLGGALAQVFTYDLLTDYGFTKDQITTVTFASPVPFSDEAIASTLYDNLKVFNYINIHDFVPKYGVTNNTNSALSLYETAWNEISNAAGFTDSGFPGGFVAAGSNLGYNIYMDGIRQSDMLAEHSLSTYTGLLNDFLGSGDVKCYAIDTRDSALWDYIKEK